MKVGRWIIIGLSVALFIAVALLTIQWSRTSSLSQVSSRPKHEQITMTLVLPETLFSSPPTKSQQIDATIILPASRASSKPDYSQYLTIILTGLFTLFGSSIVLLYRYFAGNSARKFEWGKHLWDKYQEDYLGLRSIVRETSDPEMIHNKLQSLQGSVILPPKLEDELLDLITLLQGSETIERKKRARRSFLRGFESFVARPWTYL